MNQLSLFLKTTRTEMQMSLREFANFLGISHTYLDKLEKCSIGSNGKEISPTIDTLIKIATAFGMTLTEFLEICAFIEKPKETFMDANNTQNIDLENYVDNIIFKILQSENVTYKGKPVQKKDVEVISDAIHIGLQLVLKRNQ